MEGVQGREACKAGSQFGSRLIGGLLPGITMDYLPEILLCKVTNLSEFLGILVLDKWMCNSDERQAVFHKDSREKNYTATFIDQGYCFNAGAWTFNDAPLSGVYGRNLVYESVTGWNSFEPWLNEVERMDPQFAWELASKMPPDWYDGQFDRLEQLIEELLARRTQVPALIAQFRESSRNPFPHWQISNHQLVARGSRKVLEWTL